MLFKRNYKENLYKENSQATACENIFENLINNCNRIYKNYLLFNKAKLVKVVTQIFSLTKLQPGSSLPFHNQASILAYKYLNKTLTLFPMTQGHIFNRPQLPLKCLPEKNNNNVFCVECQDAKGVFCQFQSLSLRHNPCLLAFVGGLAAQLQ